MATLGAGTKNGNQQLSSPMVKCPILQQNKHVYCLLRIKSSIIRCHNLFLTSLCFVKDHFSAVVLMITMANSVVITLTDCQRQVISSVLVSDTQVCSFTLISRYLSLKVTHTVYACILLINLPSST